MKGMPLYTYSLIHFIFFILVCTPILPKMIAAKGDIYKTQDLEVSNQKSSNVDLAVDKSESQDTNSNLNEVSMELCTPGNFFIIIFFTYLAVSISLLAKSF